MTITNKLVVQFDYQTIDQDFDFFKVSTSKNYIDKAARVLDTTLDEIKALSIAFDYGKSAFLMFEKGSILQQDLGAYLSKQDDTLSVEKIKSSQLWSYLLLRLFLHALANKRNDPDGLSNLSGKFFITDQNWILYEGSRIKVLQIDITRDLELTAEAATFTDITKFGPLAKDYSYKYPMYVLSRQKGIFKRVFSMDFARQKVYIKKAKAGVRTRISFLDLHVDQSKRKQCKSWYLFNILERLKSHFRTYFSIGFQEVNPVCVVSEPFDRDYMAKVASRISEKGINIFSMVSKEHVKALEKIQKAIESRLGNGIAVVISDGPNPSMFNIALIHAAEYYAENSIPDPYKNIDRSLSVQAVTIEDSLPRIEEEMEGGRQPLLCTLLKELVIKDDIISRSKICLDEWKSREFTEDWVFGIEHAEPGKTEKRYFFMKISPDGSLSFAEKKPFSILSEEYQACFNYLNQSKDRGKVVVSDGKNAIMISRTNRFPLPNPDIFLTSSPKGNESKSNNFSGLCGINYYREEGTEFYNVGFVNVNDIQGVIPNASVIYKTTVFKGENFIDRFLETMSVIFVKHNNFTVVPFPVKYLREYIELAVAGGNER